MKTSGYTEAQILAIPAAGRRRDSGDRTVPGHGMSCASFYRWTAKYGGMDVSPIS